MFDKSAGAEKNEETGAGTTRVLSLSDILYRSEANSDSSHDMSRSEREDSDYDEELELDIQTSLSDDEGRDPDSNAMRGSLNLRIHRVGDDKPMENTVDNASSGTASSSQNDRTSYQVSYEIMVLLILQKKNKLSTLNAFLSEYLAFMLCHTLP